MRSVVIGSLLGCLFSCSSVPPPAIVGPDGGPPDPGVDAGTDAGVDLSDAGLTAAVCPTAVPAAGTALHVGAEALSPGRAYVVYSGIGPTAMPGRLDNTSNIVVLKGAGHEVWLFGAGYGDPGGDVLHYRRDRDATRSARADAAEVDAVVRGCFGESPATAALRFVAPHFHLDHVNQEFLSELAALGYARDTTRAFVQVRDRRGALCGTGAAATACCGAPTCTPQSPLFGAPFAPAWAPEWVARFEDLGTQADVCGTEVLRFEVPGLGSAVVRTDQGHTAGSLNLDLPDLNARFDGAEGTCPTPQGYLVFPAHGNYPQALP